MVPIVLGDNPGAALCWSPANVPQVSWLKTAAGVDTAEIDSNLNHRKIMRITVENNRKTVKEELGVLEKNRPLSKFSVPEGPRKLASGKQSAATGMTGELIHPPRPGRRIGPPTLQNPAPLPGCRSSSAIIRGPHCVCPRLISGNPPG